MKAIFFSILIMGLCQSTCRKAKNDCVGKVIEDCICTQEYNPVCGCDNKTYGNACGARCAGIKSWVAGECP